MAGVIPTNGRQPWAREPISTFRADWPAARSATTGRPAHGGIRRRGRRRLGPTSTGPCGVRTRPFPARRRCAISPRSRGRVGWATGPALLYATGGVGYANIRYSTLTAAGGFPAAGTTGVYTADRWGYAIGAGLEYGFAPNWSAKLEYIHYGFEDITSPGGTRPSDRARPARRYRQGRRELPLRLGGPGQQRSTEQTRKRTNRRAQLSRRPCGSRGP